MGTATSAAARSGLRLQPLAKTPTLEAVPRHDVPVLSSRPNSRDAVAHSVGAVDRANLWSSDGTQGTRGNFNAGQQQQQQLEMSLRNDDAEEEVRRGDDAEEEVRRGDDAEEEREMDHVAVDESTRQDKVLTAAEELDSASYSPSSSSLKNDSNYSLVNNLFIKRPFVFYNLLCELINLLKAFLTTLFSVSSC